MKKKMHVKFKRALEQEFFKIHETNTTEYLPGDLIEKEEIDALTKKGWTIRITQ